jgi:pimeloyl-ACP methyl ester carboxylesterase
MQIQTNGCQIGYEVRGSGPPVVLIHGLGCSRAIWSRLRDRLQARHTVLAYDLRGSGETRETAPSPGLSLEVWSDDLRALLGALGLARPVLVGHSLGASVSLKYAIRWPDDVAALVLVGGDPDLSRLAPRMERMAELMGELGIPEWVERHWSHNPPFSAASLERTPGVLAEYRAMVLANDAEDYQRTCRAIAASEDLTAALPGLTQPALVLGGAADDRTLPEAGRTLAELLGNGTYVELADVGHTPPLEAPDAMGAAIEDFLARLPEHGAAAAAEARDPA